MDYSIISNKTNITESEHISDGQLSEKYNVLQKEHCNLLSKYDAIKQELHDTRRNYQTALDIQSHLTAELEITQSNESKLCNDLTSRINALQKELAASRQENLEIGKRHQIEIKKLENENKHLKEEPETLPSPVIKNNTEADDLRVALSCAVSEGNKVKAELDLAKAETASWQMKVEELVIQISEMQTNAEIRKEELNEAGKREEAALVELAKVKVLLHQTGSQDLQAHAAKGNSIFAEVEDKRQEMAKNVIQMKQTNSRLRKDLATTQEKLEALIHEKQTKWDQQACEAAHHDQELIEKYESHITELERMCEKRRRELCRWYNNLTESNVQAGLPGLLSHLKNECEGLRAEVCHYSVTQLANAVQIRELRQQIARLTSDKESSSVNGDYIAPLKLVKNRPVSVNIEKKVSFN